MVGKSLSHYKILEELGRGGMGIVYKGEDTNLHRTVAIKVLPAAALSSDEDRARFYREARAAASLSHPNIAVIHEIDEAVPEGSKDDDLRPFIAMEFIEGDTLEDRIKQGPMKLEEAVRIASEIASGLEAAHKKDIVHRDIKAANVMLDDSGRAKILDFGLAQTAASTKLTRMGSTLGTVAYMSPEQARGEEVDSRTDLWALGVTLYEMVAGKHPFPGDYEQAAVYSILNEDPEPLTAIRTGVPMGIEWVVSKCLAKKANARYQNATDLLVDLTGLDVRAPTVSSNRTTSVRRNASARQHYLRYAIATFAGVAITLFAVFAFRDRLPVSATPFVTTLHRLTIETVREYHPDIHPDGNMVVYAAGETYKQTKLYYRSIAGSSASPLTNSFSGVEQKPSISPDGNHVTFLSAGGLFVVDYPGGVPTPVIPLRPGDPEIISSTWAPDGVRIAFATTADSIFVFNQETRERAFITSLREPHSLAWSAAGDHLAVVSVNPNSRGVNPAPSGIFIVRISDGQTSRLTDPGSMNASPVWSQDGQQLFFVSNRGGGGDIYMHRVDSSNKPEGDPERITTGLRLHTIDLSDDGSHFVGSEVYFSQNIWSSDISQGSVVSTRDAIPITAGEQIIYGMQISHNGEWLAFDSDSHGDQNIFVMPASGGNPRQITSHPAPDFLSSWSPDDDEIGFHSYRGDDRNAYSVSLSDNSITPIAAGPLHERYPIWSADGSKIGVRVTVGRGEQRHYESSRRPDGSRNTPEPHTNARIGTAKYSPVDELILYDFDGALWLYDQVADHSRKLVGNEKLLSGVGLSGSNEEISSGVGFSAYEADWSMDGQTVYFRAKYRDESDGIWSIPITGVSPRQVLRRSGNEWGYGDFSVGRDRLYYTLWEVDSDLWVMELSQAK